MPEMILSAALMHGLGHQPGAWRVRGGPATDYVSPDMYGAIARKAEEGKLHVLFLAEQITNQEVGAQRPCGAMDTASVLSYMAAVTSRIGLVGTASTTYNQPYDLARRFATLDHLSKGRAGWNCVTTAHAVAAQMFGTGSHPEAPQRYSRADEFLDVVIRLWESWEPDALVGDKKHNVFADASKIHAINHAGESFSVRGPLPFPRSRQGRPLIFHAGSSPTGRDQAAKFADVVFTAQHTTEGAKAFRTDLRRRAQAHGRHPDSIKILPGMNVVLGETVAEARRKKAALDNAQTLDQLLATMARICGVSPALLRDHLDRPFPVAEFPPDAELKNGVGWRKSIIDLATEEKLTTREVLTRAPSSHHHIVGTAADVADAMEERLAAQAADGFTMMVDMLPEGINDIVDLLVPELQRRGLFHREYSHRYLRDALGLEVGTPQVARQDARELVP
ncbi:MAG: NtaA/DmoA family FMN-dependent monooxygenase [Xanthobacteraceae bacterium]|nr:NtaA/DmoA family FMN-dependent monooxygenase [Xanthobacteraceae bacterium]